MTSTLGKVEFVHGILDTPGNLGLYFPQLAARPGHEIVGFGWFQGWQDGCGQGDTDEYEFNLVRS